MTGSARKPPAPRQTPRYQQDAKISVEPVGLHETTDAPFAIHDVLQRLRMDVDEIAAGLAFTETEDGRVCLQASQEIALVLLHAEQICRQWHNVLHGTPPNPNPIG